MFSDRPTVPEGAKADPSVFDLLVLAAAAACAVLAFVPPFRIVGTFGAVIAAGMLLRVFNRRRPVQRAGAALRSPKEVAGIPVDDLLETLPVAILLIAADGVVTSATVEARRLLGREVAGLPISLVFRSPTLLAAIEEAGQRQVRETFDFRVQRPRAMTLSATIRSGSAGPSRSVVLMLQDSTDRRLIEDARSDFVANASHELRTPLAAISGLVETLQGAASDDPAAQKRFLGIISKQTDRMTRLVNDLLSLSRIEADENILPKTEQDLGAVLGDALAAVGPLAEAAGTPIETDIPPGLPMVRGSRDELQQVFVNLIENAVRYAGDAGPVRVSAERIGDSLRVIVADSGSGIEPEHLTRLTERFYRVNAADSRSRGGTGLGLAIVKHIVNRHRGALDISSVPGKGSEFIVTLPLADMPDRPQS